jgi:hypothetical protein
MQKLPQLMAVVPISVLLTVSFFVLVVIRKIEEKGLRAFGYVVAGLLWLAALVVFGAAAFGLGKDGLGAKKYRSPRSQMQMGAMPPQMMHPDGAAVINPSAGTPQIKAVKRSGCSSCSGNKGVVTKKE